MKTIIESHLVFFLASFFFSLFIPFTCVFEAERKKRGTIPRLVSFVPTSNPDHVKILPGRHWGNLPRKGSDACVLQAPP